MSPDEYRNRSETEDSIPESNEITALKHHLDAFSSYVAGTAIRDFWPNRSLHPELNGNGVTEAELLVRVNHDLKDHITENLTVISALVTGSNEPEKAFEGVSIMLKATAQKLAKSHYETLVYFKKTGIDELTGLPNRKVFNRNLKTGLERNARLGETFSFIIFDLDHFKRVNDTYGHLAGDQVLQEMARRLSQDVSLRELDLLVRYGGEEFAIILPATPKEGACVLANRIKRAVGSELYEVTDNEGNRIEISVTASIGISQFTNTLEDPRGEGVLSRADGCLYIGKGEKPDKDGITADRRGEIFCDDEWIQDGHIAHYKATLSGNGRSSFPAPRQI